MKPAIIIAMMMTMLFAAFSLPMAAAQKAKGYDMVMQDDSGCPVLKLNSTTGQYLFFDDEGLVLAGVGTIQGGPYQLTVTFKNSGYFGRYTCDLKTKLGTGMLIETSEWEVEAVINDSDITNNTGECAVE